MEEFDLNCIEPTEIDNTTFPLTSIIMYNAANLTNQGLTNLCSNYGAVVGVRKHKTKRDIAFVDFATESDATMAIQQLNSKLGFGYRATFAYPPGQKIPKASHEPVEQMNDADWEKDIVSRRFNYGLMPPLSINFPEFEPLYTKPNYFSEVEGPALRAVDPQLLFSIQNVMQFGNVEESLSCDSTERQERLAAYSKTSGGGQFRSDANQFKHSGLTIEERATFGEIKLCIVCGGYGFVYCSKCGIHYCSVNHQKQHTSKHDTICPGKSGNDGKAMEDNTPTVGCALTSTLNGFVLTIDPLPTKATVYITEVLTADRVFIRSANHEAERTYLQTLGDCDRTSLSAKTALETNTKVVAGEIYLAPYAQFGTYGRVLVVEVGSEKSKCVFIEHGTLSFVSNESFKVIDDTELKYRKVQIYKICLAGITDELGQIEKAIVQLNKLKKQPLEMKHRIEAGNMVDVHLRTSGGISVNETINRIITIPAILSEKDHESYIMYADVPQTQPTLGQNKSIMILNRTTIQYDGRVSWISMEDVSKLEMLQNKLQSYGKKVCKFRRYFTPRIGELCLVRSLGNWYRGVCHETAGDCKPALFLCDYGCMVIADLTEIRKIPAQLATEVCTHDGVVQGLTEAKAGGLQLDSDFLDIYLPENETLIADISQETKNDPLLPGDGEPEIYTILKMHEYSYFIESVERGAKPSRNY